MEKNERKMHLPSIDNLFTTQEERENENLEKVVYLDIDQIDEFPEHPFKVMYNQELKDMMDSIKEKGVLVPTIVRQKADGRYEMISGHRRKKASELLELKTVPCIIRDLTDEEATIIMVDSNLQRETILPSEKAYAYKMKIDAMNRQGERTDLTFSQVGKRLNIYEDIASNSGESRSQIHRYIRLTNLIPKILEYVDNSVIKDSDKLSIALSPAVEISYLKKEEQESLLDYIDCYQITPSHAQAIKLKELSQKGAFTVEKMETLLDEEKPNQKEKLNLSYSRFDKYIPQELKSNNEKEDYILKAVVFYDAHLRKQKTREHER